MSVRGAAEIGAGLAAARRSRPIEAGERIHVIGAQGAGASAAALLAAAKGKIEAREGLAVVLEGQILAAEIGFDFLFQ